jgi:argininosuccinate lyase
MRAFGIPFPALLDPREGMKSREVAGGTGPKSVAQALAAAKHRLDEMNA